MIFKGLLPTTCYWQSLVVSVVQHSRQLHLRVRAVCLHCGQKFETALRSTHILYDTCQRYLVECRYWMRDTTISTVEMSEIGISQYCKLNQTLPGHDADRHDKMAASLPQSHVMKVLGNASDQPGNDPSPTMYA